MAKKSFIEYPRREEKVFFEQKQVRQKLTEDD